MAVENVVYPGESLRSLLRRAASIWSVAAVAAGLCAAAPSAASAQEAGAATGAPAADALFDDDTRMDVLDAADDPDPFDIRITPSFKRTLYRAKVTREAPCNPEATEPAPGEVVVNPPPNSRARFPRLVEASRCAEPTVVTNKELRAWREINELDVLVQIGLFRDVELHANLPVIFSDQRGVSYAGNGGDRTQPVVDETNSSVDPSNERIIQDITLNEDLNTNGAEFTTFRLFNVRGEGNLGPERAGFGDMNIGLAWNPFNDQRDDTKAKIRLGFDYLIPTGEVAKGGNEGVGRGVHELQWSLGASKRFKYMDPYFSVSYTLPLAAGTSLFTKKGAGQGLESPGQRAEILFGSEFIPFEDRQRGHFFHIDFGLSFGYTAEGRDYSLLFDALANSSCNGLTPREIRGAVAAVKGGSTDAATVDKAACHWLLEQPANARTGLPVFDPYDDANQDVPFGHDGITDYEAYGTLGAHLGFTVQAARYIQFSGNLRLQHQLEHFITAARTGIDSEADANTTVRFDNPDERNPYYNPVLDAVGNRFRVEEMTVFTWSLALGVQF